jgi:Acetyltransferase (GNAT) domain
MSYTVETDQLDEGRWHALLQEFDDATLFQSWGYGVARWGERHLSHTVIKKDGKVVALAQTILVGAPLVGKTLAFVNFGPVWQRRSAPPNAEHLAAALRALREEFVAGRRMCLRIRPWLHDLAAETRECLRAEGLTEEDVPSYTTYVVDLSPSEGALRDAMDKKWRANLRKAEQCALTVTREGGDGVGIFSELHRQMRHRKQFSSGFMGMLPKLYEVLPPDLRPEIFVCWNGEAPVAAAIVSGIGNRAFYVNGASADLALEVRGGHFLQWAIVRALKEEGRCRWYDLYGVTGSTPGVHQFKRGIVGAKAPEIPMPLFETCGSYLSALVVGGGERLQRMRESLQGRWSRVAGRP